MKPVPREKSVTQAIMRWLRAQGHHVVKLHGGAFGTGGMPDLLCLVRLPGHSLATPLFVEVKRPGGKPTARQEATVGALNRAGGFAIVADSVDKVRAALEDMRGFAQLDAEAAR